MFNSLHSLLQVFNLPSFIGLPGHSDASSESTAWSLLTILLIGLMAEVVRRSLDTQHIFAYLSELFYLTVSFDEHDPCYGMLSWKLNLPRFFFWSQKSEWVLAWLSKQPKWSEQTFFFLLMFILRFDTSFVETIRTASISTTVIGGRNGHSRLGSTSTNTNSSQMIYTVPEVDKTYWIRTSQGYWVSICRRRQEAAWVCFAFFFCMPITCYYSGAYAVAKMENVLQLRWAFYIYIRNLYLITCLSIKDHHDQRCHCSLWLDPWSPSGLYWVPGRENSHIHSRPVESFKF